MAAAAIRPMMAIAREEAAVVTADAAMAARTAVTTEATAAVRASAGKEILNPVAVRHAAESSAKQALDRAGWCRALSSYLEQQC